ncbi:branched-chain amino acid ABC transporter permease [Candidatus Gracilibacteria bacterium]|nr:branched-chain amino acid ABC transporter permease [Candidatus Gracilibacteria bacterium]
MEILPQILVISIIASAIYALIAAGLTLTFGTLEFINFAHGEIAMAGAFVFLYFFSDFGLGIFPALIVTTLIIAALGMFIERTTFRPVRDKQEFIPLVLSIGISILISAAVMLKFGGGSHTYAVANEMPTVYRIWNEAVIISQTQIVIILSSVVLISALFAFLKYSKTGKAIRAVSDNKQVAAILGINVNRTIVILFTIASGLAAIAGILIAFDQNLNPRMGLQLSIKAFAAIILGGVGKLHGAILGAIIIGFSENMIVGLTNIPSSYKSTIVFTIFIIVLIFKPYGIFGGNKEEVESR